MSLAAYPGRLAEVKTTIAWKDAIARLAPTSEEGSDERFDAENPPDSIVRRILPDVLRRLHAEHAEDIAEQTWRSADGSHVHLVEDSELRQFYGPTIGQIAHSHWWSVQKLEQEFSDDLGALANRTRNRVDRIKLARLLRVADALHLDSRRAPRFLRAIITPSGLSALHWSFQERLAKPHIELDAVVFTTGQPFGREHAEAWWLAYDTLNAADRELREVDLLLQSRNREVLKARRVKGAGSPDILSRTVQVRGWRPVDTRLQVSDVPRIVENLGGTKLYGKDPTVSLRELIQNAADAVQARRKFQNRPENWGLITVRLLSAKDGTWLIIEDNGIGMSEQVLTGPLLDFGMSFWRSPLATEEFPGLMAAGMHAIGRFGIGFFSVFMLGSVVRVYSRRCDKGQDTGRLLEFRGGTRFRPILSPISGEPVPVDGGTRIEILLKYNIDEADGLLHVSPHNKGTMSLHSLVGAIAPNLDVAIDVIEQEGAQQVVRPGDWLKISDLDLVRRLDPALKPDQTGTPKADRALMQPLKDVSGQVYGRAFISPSTYVFSNSGGWVTISGLRATRVRNVQGVLLGEAVTAARDAAQPLATREALAKWASTQAEKIAATVKDEERQARSAEVVLECGGEIGNLKLIKLEADWLTEVEFVEWLRSSTEILIHFDGEFEYDEYLDEVHPQEFRNEFTVGENTAIVLRHDGSILKNQGNSWPRSIMEHEPSIDSNVAIYIKEIIRRVWGEEHQVENESRVVGKAGFTEITRDVTVFRPTGDEDLF